jgi:hypothetical protein
MPKTEVAGTDIKGIKTLSSIYDNGKIVELTGNGKTYRMDVKEFLKLITDETVFEAEKKAKHTYLTIKRTFDKGEAIFNDKD